MCSIITMASISPLVLLALLATTSPFLADAAASGGSVDLRRCFVCARASSTELEAWPEAPSYADECVEVVIQAPEVCTDLLSEERLRALKDERLQQAAELEASSEQNGFLSSKKEVFAKKLEVAKLWNALRRASAKKTEEQWADLVEAMNDSALEMGKHGLSQEAGQMMGAREIVKGARSSLRGGGKKSSSGSSSLRQKTTMGGSIIQTSSSLASWGHQEEDMESENELPVINIMPSAGPSKLDDVPRLNLPEDPLFEI